ncbi:hypothetical protein D3C83_180520 [compost metagenome]
MGRHGVVRHLGTSRDVREMREERLRRRVPVQPDVANFQGSTDESMRPARVDDQTRANRHGTAMPAAAERDVPVMNVE